MKKILCALLVLSVFVCFTASLVSCDKSGEAQMGFKIISTDINDFTLQVPSDWTVTSQNGYVSATAVGEKGDKSNVSVMSKALSDTEVTAESYFEDALESYGELYENIEIEGRDIDTELGDRNAKKYVFTGEILGQKYKFMQVICIYNGRAYTFTYTSTEQYYTVHETEVAFIIDYFTFKV